MALFFFYRIESSVSDLVFLDIGIPEIFDGEDIKNLQPQGLQFLKSSHNVCITIDRLEANVESVFFLIGLVESNHFLWFLF